MTIKPNHNLPSSRCSGVPFPAHHIRPYQGGGNDRRDVDADGQRCVKKRCKVHGSVPILLPMQLNSEFWSFICPYGSTEHT